MGMSTDNVRGLALALTSCVFIGSSFIIKKIGLQKAGMGGLRAGDGGFSYLLEPWWWYGMITMIVGEIANFAAYAFAPAILVTPLGALSIIVSAVLAHFVLHENLHKFGIVGCILCMVGSAIIVINAPPETEITSVKQVWSLAWEPGFVAYIVLALAAGLLLIFYFAPRWGHQKMVIYIGICSLFGSLTVVSVKAVGIALKLSFLGNNQFKYVQTWFFLFVVIGFIIIQLNYLNKALDTFNTAVVSPVYYVMFTILTILASMIMFKEGNSMTARQYVSELFGFITIIAGTYLLHKTRDMGNASSAELPVRSHPHELSRPHATHITSLPRPSSLQRSSSGRDAFPSPRSKLASPHSSKLSTHSIFSSTEENIETETIIPKVGSPPQRSFLKHSFLPQ